MITGYFFNAILNEDGSYTNEYGAEDHADYFGTFVNNGVFANDNPNACAVELTDMDAEGVYRAVSVADGKAFINGYLAKITGGEKLQIPDTEGQMKYRVMLRLDLAPENNGVSVELKAGTSTKYPDPQRDEIAYELVLANVSVIGVTRTMTDLRSNPKFCGYCSFRGQPAYQPPSDVPANVWDYTLFPETMTSEERATVENDPALKGMYEDSRIKRVANGMYRDNRVFLPLYESQTWTVPENIITGENNAYIIAVGGGGGGGGKIGGGGGSGEVKIIKATLTAGQQYVVVIGAGGTGGENVSTTASNGGDGGTTSFGALVSAAGGKGGGGNGSSSTGGYGGDGAAGGGSATSGKPGGNGTQFGGGGGQTPGTGGPYGGTGGSAAISVDGTPFTDSLSFWGPLWSMFVTQSGASVSLNSYASGKNSVNAAMRGNAGFGGAGGKTNSGYGGGGGYFSLGGDGNSTVSGCGAGGGGFFGNGGTISGTGMQGGGAGGFFGPGGNSNNRNAADGTGAGGCGGKADYAGGSGGAGVIWVIYVPEKVSKLEE